MMDPETIEGQDTSEEATPTLEEHSSQASSEQSAETGYNPVWEPIRTELGLQFETIKPTLAEIDKNFNEHVTKVNGQYEPWKQFDTEGVTPDQVRNAFAMLQNLNDNPREIYDALGKFLAENGQLPETPAEVAKVAADAAQDDEFLTDEQKQIKAMEQQIADMRALFEGQQTAQQEAQQAAQQERMVQEARTILDKEISDYVTAHPNLSTDDINEIQQRHYAYALQGPEFVKSFAEVGSEYEALLQRVRSAPRATDTAPRLPGAGGAAPTGQTRDPSTFTRAESQDALAALVASQNQ